MKKPLVALLVACAAFAAPTLSAKEPVAAKHGLQTLDAAWVKAMLANDAEACAALYADDAVLVLPGTPALKGKKAISEAYAGWLKDNKVTDASVSDAHYRSAGETSSGWGAYQVTTVPKAGGAPATEVGTWCAVAARQKDGSWKYVSDHAALDPPAKK